MIPAREMILGWGGCAPAGTISRLQYTVRPGGRPMPEMTIRLRCDPETGKRDIVVQLHSDADALPVEHEQLHRDLVDKLVNGSILPAGEAGKPCEAGKLGVEREPEKGSAADLPVGEPIPPERRAAAEGS